MKAFLDDPKIKKKYVDRVQKHYDYDEIVQGIYWEKGRGCGVGCTVERSDSPHEAMENELGIPKELAYLEDTIFEGLTNGEAKAFPLRFLKAIKPGADLSLVTAKFMVWQFEDEKLGLKNIAEVQEDKEVMGFCEEVFAMYKRVIAGDAPSEDDFYQLYLKIDRAWAWAGAWVGAWAGAGAWAWARAGAWARAWAWAGAWAGARAEKPYWSAMADKLVELLGEASK